MPTGSWESLRGDPTIGRLRKLTRQATDLVASAKITGKHVTNSLDLGWLDRAVSRAASRFTIIVIGQVSSGKSSFVNSLLGRKLFLPSDRPTDGVVSVLQATDSGEPEHAEKVLRDGSIIACSVGEATRFLRQQDTPVEEQLNCREVRIHLDEPWLRQLRVVNTPGLGDRLEAFQNVALDYLHEDESDLVVWTFFPDSAANDEEVGLFSDALLRRQGAVLGVVTRCLEGKEGDTSYDPRYDPALTGDDGVRNWLLQNVGRYLRDVIFYDSHAVRRLVRRMRENPELQSEDAFAAELDRSGYTHLQRSLAAILGDGHERIHEARVISLMKQCGAHAVAVADSLVAVEDAHEQNAQGEREQIEAWRRLEGEIVGPARACLKTDIQALAQERSKELVSIMGNSGADTIDANFELLGTLTRSLVSWTGLCEPAADVLNKKIDQGINDALAKVRFHERLYEAQQRLITEHLTKLQRDLQRAEAIGASDSKKVPIDPGKPAGAVDGVLGDALLSALKGVVSAVLKSLAKDLETRAAAAAAKEAAGQATKQAATKASEAAAKHAAKKTAGAAAARTLGIITLVLVPFDVAKLIKDFRKGRQHLSDTVRTRYQAEGPVYDARIFDVLWPGADERLSVVLRDARATLDKRSSALASHVEMARRAAALRTSLLDLETRFAERCRE
jgi:hypothetical protein